MNADELIGRYRPEELVEHYYKMLVIREFEEALSEMFAEGLVPGTAHFCIGQEACAVGAIAALRADDLVTSNHRGHGHFIAKGGDPARLMAELLGRAAGYCGGRSGSQHLCNIAAGFLGSNGITGGMIPVATGAALAQKMLKTGRVVLCFFGDGATGQGAFHEAVNLGAIWELPIVYFCENNQYAMSFPVARAFRESSVARRAAAYGIPAQAVDGMDYFAVRVAVEEAVERARGGGGPTLIEALTYRFCGHSKSDRCEYRSQEEEEQWRRRDPVGLMEKRLRQAGVLSAQEEERMRQRAREEIEQAVRFARSAPEPDPATATEGVFVSMG